MKRNKVACLFLAVVGVFWGSHSLMAAVPPPERLLTDDTLLIVTAPDFGKLRDTFKKSPPSQFWDDPAMKPFRDNFVSKWNSEFVHPLEKELNVKFDDYSSLPQGQLTFAVTQGSSSTSSDSAPPALLLILDARDKISQLKKNLTDLRKKWTDSGRNYRTEKIRGYEFSVLSMTGEDVPKTLQKFFPKQPPVQEAGSDDSAKSAPAKAVLVVGQADSLLILGTSIPAIEKVVTRLGGGSVPALGELAAFQGCQLAMFRDAPLYGWINAKACIDSLTRKAAEAKDSSDAPNPFDAFSLEKIAGAIGLKGLKTVAFNCQSGPEGAQIQLYFGVPESSRQGLFKLLIGEPKETSPPPFVPADAVKFQRWRLDGQKAWATLEKMLTDFSPQAIGALNFVMETANANARDKDPGFDIRKNLIGNLGDDMIAYEKAPSSGDKVMDAPSLFLLGSPNAEQLAAALKSVFVLMSQQAGAPSEREFLGRKIFSVPLPSVPLPMASGMAASPSKTLHYAASGSYVAFSTEPSMVEEYLRSSDTQRKALREIPGLTEASQKVTGPGTGLFGYDNRAETMRAAFDSLKKNPGAVPSSLGTLSSAAGIALPTQQMKDWMDYSLLPSFDRVSKYFYFTVYGGSANVDGISFKLFAPTPPGLRTSSGTK